MRQGFAFDVISEAFKDLGLQLIRVRWSRVEENGEALKHLKDEDHARRLALRIFFNRTCRIGWLGSWSLSRTTSHEEPVAIKLGAVLE